MFQANQKDCVALDIETSGLQADAEVTVLGLLPEVDGKRTAHVVLNTGDRPAKEEDIVSVVEDCSRDRVDLHVRMSEAALLETAHELIFEYFDRERNRLVTFNGETWHGGFDIPYLRTRCTETETDWILNGCDIVDLYPIIKKHFHTLHPDENGDLEEHNDLVRAHQNLVHPDHEFDPYDDSGEAVTDYWDTGFTELVQHNISDIHRTLDLAHVCEKVAKPHMKTERL